jgi:hypothetical protein
MLRLVGASMATRILVVHKLAQIIEDVVGNERYMCLYAVPASRSHANA